MKHPWMVALGLFLLIANAIAILLSMRGDVDYTRILLIDMDARQRILTVSFLLAFITYLIFHGIHG